MKQIADVSITPESADWLADFTRSIVNDRLAACGNIVPSIRSIYRWESAIEDDAEALVVLHTRQSLIPAIIERASRDHPYDTPQVLAVPVTDAKPRLPRLGPRIHPGRQQTRKDRPALSANRPRLDEVVRPVDPLRLL